MPFASRARAVCRHLGASLLVAAVLPGALAIAAEEPAAPTPPAQATGPAADAPPVPPAPATEAPPADAPATDAPATDAPPTAPQPSAVAPAEAPPADVLPAAAPVVDPPDEVPAASVPLEPQPAAPLPPLDVHAPACSATAAACLKNNTFALWPRLRLRTGYQYVADDPQILYIGRNDGFALDSARIGVDGALRDTVRFRLVIETASLLGGTAATPVTPILAALRDAWVQWTLAPALAVSVGQQFMPSDIEGMTTIAANPFSQRSVATSGVRAGQGIAVTGLSPTRQLGVVLANAQPLVATALAGEDLAFAYSLGVSNGNGQNLQGNDNKLPAAYLRLQGAWGKTLELGVGGRVNPRTVGVAPNLFSETDTVGFVDVSAHVAGFFATAQGIARSTALSTLVPGGGAAGTESGMGGTVWLFVDEPLGVSLFGLKPGVRLSAFDPSSAFSADELVETTLGVRWDVPGALMHDALEPMARLPLTVFLDYVILTEVGAGARDLSNNRLTALLQLDL